MRKIREVLRQSHLKCSQRAIAASLGMSKGTVGDYQARAKKAGLEWPQVTDTPDEKLEALLFVEVGRNEPAARVSIDLPWVYKELRRPGVTLRLLWEEYAAAATASAEGARAYQYSQFCDIYQRYAKTLPVVMRQHHVAGQKGFVDYSGKKPHIVDRATGELIEVELFVLVLGASNYTYAEATMTQTLPDFVGSHIRAFEYFEGTPHGLVPDQLRSAVSKSDRHDPDINLTYGELAKHYGTVIVPARPRKSRDKAKVEVCVQVAQRWILARLRNRTFFSIEELNTAIWELLEDLNTRPFCKLEGCRQSQFLSLEKPALIPLPAERYVLTRWKQVTVNIDYHFEYEGRLYSVPHTLVRQQVEVRATATTVEALHRGVRIALHRRSYGPKGTATTTPEHRPKSHRDYGDWSPARVIAWAQSVGANVGRVAEHILRQRPHPEQGYRSCLALIRTGKVYGTARTDAACARALALGSPCRKTVEHILKNGLDRVPLLDEPNRSPIAHDHVRGPDYYNTDAPAATHPVSKSPMRPQLH